MFIRAGADGRVDLHGGDKGAYEDGTDGVARAGHSIAAAPGSEEGGRWEPKMAGKEKEEKRA